ncbi:dTDP-4-dehydrorhamnose 3,5-epimerase [Hyunsoonleella sp. SJ7]|uniref:dTDP-4-dehydrorhamnose 3,5-epimerase n=1 Tax=Hyunsoonleella aquatilis TaxID=2762758 RepID=A0A923KKH2_9FLAO|nr:dTDP-4-dehydrorhamnose 3,5-epimerase [Hyunsoonleella aquatilis]MBC3758497.1 dTDP-4-dehydrorhamnose 3,5-epimerase [Hyunsoonleella aquatilis]
MTVEATGLEGCFVIVPRVFKDSRGFFFESYNDRSFKQKTGVLVNFVQDNQSISSKGTLRGLHFQRGKYAQAKLVRVIKGKVLDVCVDIRKGSPTFGQHFKIILDAIENKQLYVPRGFAHGFLTLEDNTIFSYKCDNYYNKDSEGGIIYNDPTLSIDWQYSMDKLLLSEKDIILPTFQSLINEY